MLRNSLSTGVIREDVDHPPNHAPAHNAWNMHLSLKSFSEPTWQQFKGIFEVTYEFGWYCPLSHVAMEDLLDAGQ